MRHYHTKNVEDLIRQIESDDELTKEFEDAELVESHVVSVHVATPVCRALSTSCRKPISSAFN